MAQKLLGIDLFRAANSVPTHEPGVVADDVRGKSGTVTYFDPIAGANVTRRYSPDGRYKYVRANGTIVAGDFVRLDFSVGATDRSFNVIQVSAVDQAIEGCALVGAVAGQYLWIQIAGRVHSANVANAASTPGQVLGTSATAGRLDTPTASAANAYATATGRGVRSLTAPSGNVGEAIIGD
jgi:hypothetical protein